MIHYIFKAHEGQKLIFQRSNTEKRKHSKRRDLVICIFYACSHTNKHYDKSFFPFIIFIFNDRL